MEYLEFLEKKKYSIKITLRHYGTTALLHYANMAIWQYGTTALRQYGTMAIQHYCNTARIPIT